MTRAFYSLLMWLAQPFLRARLRQRGVAEPGYRVAIGERFGRYTDDSAGLPEAATPGGFVWVHAVSLGESAAAGLLIAELRRRQADVRLLLTHGTATGRAEGARLLCDGDMQVWAPWDSPGAVRRFLAHFKPRIGILMETEVWPNMAAACQRLSIPLVLANARLSEKSLASAQRLAWLARPAYQSLAAVWAQSQDDGRRLAALGANVQGVFGNLKFDAMPDATLLARGQDWARGVTRPVVVFASSREGEEAVFLKILEKKMAVAVVGTAYTAINIDENEKSALVGHGQADGPPDDRQRHHTVHPAGQVQWLIVPRHPQRFDAVAALIVAHGFRVSRRSQWGDAPPPSVSPAGLPPAGADHEALPPTLWLGDSLGEMALYYGLADVALLGGSFEALGGQNLIEAAACGCPVIMGPHTFNFAEAARLSVQAGAAVRVGTMDQAVTLANDLVSGRVSFPAAEPVNDSAELQTMRAATARFTAAHRGALEKTVEALMRLLRG